MGPNDRAVVLAAVLLAGVVSCSDPTGPVASHPEGVIEQSDPLSARPYGAAVAPSDVVYGPGRLPW